MHSSIGRDFQTDLNPKQETLILLLCIESVWIQNSPKESLSPTYTKVES